MKDNVKPGPVKARRPSTSRRSPRTSPAWSRKAARRSPPISSRARRARSQPGLSDEVTDVVKTLGEVAEYWLSDPQRAVELQSRLGKAYLELWGAAVKRLSGEDRRAGRRSPTRRTGASPIRNGRRTSSSTSSSRPICSSTGWADHLVKDAEGLDPHTRQKAEFYVRQIANALSPSNFVLTNPELLARDARLQRREPGARHAHAGRGHRGRRRRPENPPVRRRAVRGRPQSRGLARQGDLPERADAAHPVRAVDARRC